MTSEQLEVLADMLRLGAATRAGVRLAERARDHHLRACGLTPWPWSTMSVDAQRAWVSTVALVISEAMRHEQTRRLMAARIER